MLLREVTAITLRQGQMTAGRRSSPVPQLTCIGGFAGCHVSQPKIVQCYNRGWSGQDVQVIDLSGISRRACFPQV